MAKLLFTSTSRVYVFMVIVKQKLNIRKRKGGRGGGVITVIIKACKYDFLHYPLSYKIIDIPFCFHSLILQPRRYHSHLSIKLQCAQQMRRSPISPMSEIHPIVLGFLKGPKSHPNVHLLFLYSQTRAENASEMKFPYASAEMPSWHPDPNGCLKTGVPHQSRITTSQAFQMA